MTRGVGSILLYYIMNESKHEGKILKADFLRTDKNKIMYLTYKFANFIETSRDEATGKIQFENDLSFIPAYPAFIDLKVPATAMVAAWFYIKQFEVWYGRPILLIFNYH